MLQEEQAEAQPLEGQTLIDHMKKYGAVTKETNMTTDEVMQMTRGE